MCSNEKYTKEKEVAGNDERKEMRGGGGEEGEREERRELREGELSWQVKRKGIKQ